MTILPLDRSLPAVETLTRVPSERRNSSSMAAMFASFWTARFVFLGWAGDVICSTWRTERPFSTIALHAADCAFAFGSEQGARGPSPDRAVDDGLLDVGGELRRRRVLVMTRFAHFFGALLLVQPNSRISTS